MSEWLTAKQAMAYLGIGRNHFFRNIRRSVPVADIRSPGAAKAMLRWRRQDLEQWMQDRVQGGGDGTELGGAVRP